jgi:hypothetical protein
VATTLKKVDRELPLELPDIAAAIDVQQPDEIRVISVNEAEAIYLDGTPISLSLLQSELRGLARSTPDIQNPPRYRSARAIPRCDAGDGYVALREPAECQHQQPPWHGGQCKLNAPGRARFGSLRSSRMRC